MTFTLEEITKVLEEENIGDSTLSYVLERLQKLKTPKPLSEKVQTLKEVIETDEKARSIVMNKSSRIQYRVLGLYHYFKAEGINCQFSKADIKELAH